MKKRTKFFIILSILLLAMIIAILSFNNSKEAIFMNIYVFFYILILLLYFYKNSDDVINIKNLYILMYSVAFGLSPLFFVINNKSFMIQGKSIIYQFPIAIIGLIALIIGIYIFKPKKTEKKNEKNSDSVLKYNYYF